MSMQDPLADMLTRIRNAQMAHKPTVTMPASNVKAAVAQVLVDEGYVASCSVNDAVKRELTIELKYHEGVPVIEDIKRASRPGLRIYNSKDDIPSVNAGLGTAIVSTSRGVMSGRAAASAGVGGELICTVF